MMYLFHALSRHHFLRHKLQYALILVAISLGVASFISIQSINTSVLSHFKQSVHALTNNDLLPIWSEQNKISFDLYKKVKAIDGVVQVIPVYETIGMWDEKDLPVKIRYIDFLELGYLNSSFALGQNKDFGALFNDSQAAIVSPSLLKKMPADQLELIVKGKKQIVKSLGTFSSLDLPGLVVLKDIQFSGQVHMSHLTRLEVKLDPLYSQSALAAIQKILPAKTNVGNLQQRLDQGYRMIESFRVNLLSLSLVSFLVGFFIIYLSLSLGFYQRQKDISLLITLGENRAKLTVYLIGEAALLGVVGGVIGLFLGVGIGQFLLVEASRNISQLYFPVVANFQWSLTDITLGLGLALISTQAAIFSNIWRLKRVSTGDFLRSEYQEASFSQTTGRLLSVSIGFFILMGMSHVLAGFDRPYFSFASCFFLVMGLVTCIPFLLQLYFSFLDFVFRNVALLKTIQMKKYLFRYSQVAAALVIAFSLTFAIVDMTQTFRVSVIDWISGQFKADIFISNQDQRYNPLQSRLDSSVLEAVQSIPQDQLNYYYTISRFRFGFQGRKPLVSFTDTKLYFKEVIDSWESTAKIAVFASDNFLLRYDKKIGDVLETQIEGVPFSIKIVASFSDYSNEDGHIVIDQKVGRRLGLDMAPQLIHVYLKNKNQVEDVLKSLKQNLQEQELKLLTHGELRGLVIDMLNQTFVLSDSLKWVSFLAAFIGLLVNMSLLATIRIRTFSSLKALGLSFSQLLTILFSENVAIGLFSILLSILGGFSLLFFLIYGIQKFYFSWILQLSIEPTKIVVTFVFLVAMIFVLSVILAKRESVRSISEGLRYE